MKLSKNQMRAALSALELLESRIVNTGNALVEVPFVFAGETTLAIVRQRLAIMAAMNQETSTPDGKKPGDVLIEFEAPVIRYEALRVGDSQGQNPISAKALASLIANKLVKLKQPEES